MKKIKVRIKKYPKMGMGGYLPMYQNGTSDTIPTLDEPGYFTNQPKPTATAKKDTIRAVAPAPYDSIPTIDSLVVDSLVGPLAHDSLVTKTPAGKVKKEPVKVPQPVNPGFDPSWGLYGTGAAGALYGAYRLGQGSRGVVKAGNSLVNPGAIITPYHGPGGGQLQLPSREMKANELVNSLYKRAAYTTEELATLKKMGVTDASIARVVSNIKNGTIPAAKIAQAAEAAKSSEGLWNTIRSGYGALRAAPWFKALRKQEGGDPDSMLENIGEFLDPTGISSYDDVYRTFKDPQSAWWEKGLSVAGALPIVGKFGKGAKAFSEMSKLGKAAHVAGKVLTPVRQIDTYVNPVSKFVAAHTTNALKNAPRAVQAAAHFGSATNQGNRFFNGMDMLMGYEMGGELDTMEYGGQKGWGLDLNTRRSYAAPTPQTTDSFARTLSPVSPEDATYEAEKGEVLIGDPDKDGQRETMVFGGKRHSQGGTPSNAEGFIFSDTKNMRLKGPIVEEFGKKAGKNYTPAALAKQYDLTKYKAVIDDPNADYLQKKTAQIMYDNYERKLAKLATVQESMKGFPKGIPDFAAEAYPELAERLEQSQQPQMEGVEEQMMRWGGYPRMQEAGTTPVKKTLPTWYNFFTKANTPQGAKSRTGVTTTYIPDNGSMYDDYDYWSQQAGRDFSDAKDMQRYMFGELIKDDPAAVNAMLKEYGYPSAHTLADGILGARSAKALKMRLKNNKPSVNKPVDSKSTGPATNAPTIDQYQMQQGEDPQYTGPQDRIPYNRFDVANIMGALATPVKMYGPRAYLPNMEQIQGVYDQPDYNPLLSANNTRAQMNNTFGNAGAAMAANTYNPELMQGLIQETARARGSNLNIANTLAGQNNQIRNQAELMRAQTMSDNYDKWVKTQEEGDIAQKLKWRKDVLPAMQHAEKQRIMMERFNAENPQYDVAGNDWHIDFTKGKGSKDKASSGSGNYTRQHFFAETPGMEELYNRADDAGKRDIMKMYMNRAREYRSMFTKNPKSYQGNYMNPSAMVGLGLNAPVGPGADYGELDPYGYYQ